MQIYARFLQRSSSSPVMVQGAILYLWSLSGGNAAITALDTTTDHLLWQSTPMPYPGSVDPFFLYDAGTIFVGNQQNNVTYALDAVTGQIHWQQTTHGGYVIALGNSLVFVSTYTSLSALDRTTG